MNYPEHVPDEELVEIPFEPQHAQKLEALGFQKTGAKHTEYGLDLLVGPAEAEISMDATMYNTGRAILNVEDSDGNNIFHITAPPDYVIDKVTEAIQKLSQQDNPRFRMTEINTEASKNNPEFKKQLASLYQFMNGFLHLTQIPQLSLAKNTKNADNPFGMTGYYNPDKKTICIYVTERHPTDVLRSFAHELIHHWQNETGRLPPQRKGANEESGHYAQKDPVLRQREMEAYLIGNILFRDWQDENRYGPVALNENLTLANYDVVKQVLTAAMTYLVQQGAVKAYHRKAISGDMIAKDFVENIVRMLILQLNKYLQNTNNKGNWENQMQMVK